MLRFCCAPPPRLCSATRRSATTCQPAKRMPPPPAAPKRTLTRRPRLAPASACAQRDGLRFRGLPPVVRKPARPPGRAAGALVLAADGAGPGLLPQEGERALAQGLQEQGLRAGPQRLNARPLQCVGQRDFGQLSGAGRSVLGGNSSAAAGLARMLLLVHAHVQAGVRIAAQTLIAKCPPPKRHTHTHTHASAPTHRHARPRRNRASPTAASGSTPRCCTYLRKACCWPSCATLGAPRGCEQPLGERGGPAAHKPGGGVQKQKAQLLLQASRQPSRLPRCRGSSVLRGGGRRAPGRRTSCWPSSQGRLLAKLCDFGCAPSIGAARVAGSAGVIGECAAARVATTAAPWGGPPHPTHPSAPAQPTRSTPPYLTLPHPTLPHPTLPHPTPPNPTLPHPTSPYPTLPYPTLP